MAGVSCHAWREEVFASSDHGAYVQELRKRGEHGYARAFALGFVRHGERVGKLTPTAAELLLGKGGLMRVPLLVSEALWMQLGEIAAEYEWGLIDLPEARRRALSLNLPPEDRAWVEKTYTC